MHPAIPLSHILFSKKLLRTGATGGGAFPLPAHRRLLRRSPRHQRAPTTRPLKLGRVCPPRKDTQARFDLPPMESAEGAAQAAGAIVAAVAQGELTPLEGASVTVENYRRTLETTEMEHRMAELERVFNVAP